MKVNLFNIINILFLSLFTVIICYPFWDLILTAFSDPSETTSLGLHIWIKKWDLSAFNYIFINDRVIIAYLNTIFRTVVGTSLSVACTLLAAYPLSKKELPGRKIITVFFVICLFFSGGIIPVFLLVRSLGLINNRMALILPTMVNAFYIVVMRNYLMTIDPGLEESALMDGAGYITILTKIIIPVSKPIVATIFLWSAVYYWNEWFYALIFTRTRDKEVLQVLLRKLLEFTFADKESLDYFEFAEGVKILPSSVRAAIALITTGPIIFVYPFIQKYFIKGIMIGSVKG